MQREYLQNRNNFIRAVPADEKEKDEKTLVLFGPYDYLERR